jgi:hypothetical protein
MATRFAIGNGNWSSPAIWDNGVLPTNADVIFANNFTVTLDQDITVGSLRNTASNVYLPAMSIPLMTGNTQPSGVAFAGQNTSTAFQAFDYSTATAWTSAGINLTNCFIGYNFPTSKIIKRYYFFRTSAVQRPQSWTFEGSNDGVTYDILETVVSNSATTPYLSGILANTTAYTYYRLNVTAVNAGTTAWVYNLEMTESVGTVYGGTVGGNYSVPNTLIGSRNIVQTGDGIISHNTGSVVTTNNTSGSTVNFNVSGGGLILNQFNDTIVGQTTSKVINIVGTGAVNFNGDVYGTQTIGAWVNTTLTGTIHIGANATVTINGNVYLAKSNNSFNTFYYTISLPATVSNSAVLNINGNVIGTNNAYTSYILLESTATINITGNLISNVSPCIVTSTVSTFTGVAANINLIGTATMTNASSQPCIITRNALVTITGSVINKGDTMAIWSSRIRWQNAITPYLTVQDTTGANILLTTGTATGAYPNESDVKLGVVYSASPAKTGTCAVPSPQYVSQGVPVGSSVGTAYLNVQDIWNVLTSTITTTGSIGERLKVAATVETTGNQLAAYQ